VPKPLMPLPYTVRTGGATKGAYWVGMRYAGGDRDSEAQRFEIVFGGNEDKSALSNATVGPRGAFPRTVELLGARIAILSVTDGAMHYRIEQPMPEQDFSVLRTFIPG
jgi:hypothetical protein